MLYILACSGACVPGCVHMFNRHVPPYTRLAAWRRQLNHTGADSVFIVKCVANVFALLKCPSAVHYLGVCIKL